MPRRACYSRAGGRHRALQKSPPSHRGVNGHALTRQKQRGQATNDGTQSDLGRDSDSGPDEEYEECYLRTNRRIPKGGPSSRPEAIETDSDDVWLSLGPTSDSDSHFDSGYGSHSDAVDESADFYDDLLERFRAEGPTLANHSKGTRKMTQEQERKWIKYDLLP